jgi:hypothetical protein
MANNNICASIITAFVLQDRQSVAMTSDICFSKQQRNLPIFRDVTIATRTSPCVNHLHYWRLSNMRHQTLMFFVHDLCCYAVHANSVENKVWFGVEIKNLIRVDSLEFPWRTMTGIIKTTQGDKSGMEYNRVQRVRLDGSLDEYLTIHLWSYFLPTPSLYAIKSARTCMFPHHKRAWRYDMPFRGFTQRFRKKKIRTFRIHWPVCYSRCLLTTREGDFMDIPLQKETLKKK